MELLRAFNGLLYILLVGFVSFVSSLTPLFPLLFISNPLMVPDDFNFEILLERVYFLLDPYWNLNYTNIAWQFYFLHISSLLSTELPLKPGPNFLCLLLGLLPNLAEGAATATEPQGLEPAPHSAAGVLCQGRLHHASSLVLKVW